MDVKSESLDYIKERYKEEQNRFNHIEEKCAKLMSLLTIMISAVALVIGISSDRLLEPSGPIDWITLILLAVALFSMFCAWGHAMLALKLGDFPVASKSRKNAEYIFRTEDNAALEQIFDCYVDSTEIIGEHIAVKAQKIELAYQEMILGAVSIFIVMTVQFIGVIFR